jgi:hypothetical protein
LEKKESRISELLVQIAASEKIQRDADLELQRVKRSMIDLQQVLR